MLERRQVGIRDRLLGEIEVAENADERGGGAPVLLAEDAGDDVAGLGSGSGDQPVSAMGRISTLPVFAPGTREAASIASSRLGTSTT